MVQTCSSRYLSLSLAVLDSSLVRGSQKAPLCKGGWQPQADWGIASRYQQSLHHLRQSPVSPVGSVGSGRMPQAFTSLYTRKAFDNEGAFLQ